MYTRKGCVCARGNTKVSTILWFGIECMRKHVGLTRTLDSSPNNGSQQSSDTVDNQQPIRHPLPRPHRRPATEISPYLYPIRGTKQEDTYVVIVFSYCLRCLRFRCTGLCALLSTRRKRQLVSLGILRTRKLMSCYVPYRVWKLQNQTRPRHPPSGARCQPKPLTMCAT